MATWLSGPARAFPSRDGPLPPAPPAAVEASFFLEHVSGERGGEAAEVEAERSQAGGQSRRQGGGRRRRRGRLEFVTLDGHLAAFNASLRTIIPGK